MAPRDTAQARGRRAEELARRYLEGLGLKTAGRNLRLGGGELDLVAWDGEVLVFVEVKGRSRSDYGRAEEAVDRRKQERLVRAAEAYLARLGPPLPACRFDVVAVEFASGGRVGLRHLPDAFRPGD